MTTSPVSNSYLDELLELARAGAPEAGPYLVSLCGARLSNYVNLLAPDLSTADRDVICERAIERAARNIDNYDKARSSFDTWVRGYARFVCREYRRQNPVVPVDPADLRDTAEPASPHPAPEVGSEHTAYVRQALRQLSDLDQLIIRLRDYEQLPYESIGKMLRVQPAACRQRHARALSRLAKLIGPTYDDIGPPADACPDAQSISDAPNTTRGHHDV